MSYLTFTELQVKGRTRKWEVRSRANVLLGTVSYYVHWYKYTFNPREGTTFDATCLRDIAKFCDERTAEWQRARREKEVTA